MPCPLGPRDTACVMKTRCVSDHFSLARHLPDVRREYLYLCRQRFPHPSKQYSAASNWDSGAQDDHAPFVPWIQVYTLQGPAVRALDSICLLLCCPRETSQPAPTIISPGLDAAARNRSPRAPVLRRCDHTVHGYHTVPCNRSSVVAQQGPSPASPAQPLLGQTLILVLTPKRYAPMTRAPPPVMPAIETGVQVQVSRTHPQTSHGLAQTIAAP